MEPAPGQAERLAAFYTLSYLNVARCCGASVPAQSEEIEGRWLRDLAKMRDSFSEPALHTLAFAACAARIPAIVPTLVGAKQGLPKFTSGETFGFNVPAFALALAAAIDEGAGYVDVEMAWLDFVHRFPIKLDTDMLDWPALLWAARAVYATIGGIPVSEVGDELHRLVTGA